jgi:hypothetical protein
MRENYNLFFEKLNKRFKKYDIIKISEDCIRYDFFISLSSIIDTSDIILEYPHKNEKIDCVVKYPSNKLEAVEFKFFRPIPSGKNKPQTQLLGQLFKDFFKLKNFNEADIKTIIVVTDKNMEKYINDKFQLFKNINDDNLQININKRTLENQEKTFQDNIKPYNNVELNFERLFYKKIIQTGDEYIVAIFNIK